ncbi:MAG: hypothetical protein JWN98_701 [Abditibacteriota bacterium]|nr:hypothetical protein [Abditibacteriota bacterium]
MMRRVRVGIVGAGAITEGAILPALSGADMMAPPDSGAWWQRHSGGPADIDYQASVRPEVVALADARPERAQRVGQAARVHTIYTDWRAMLRETSLDVLICALPPDECLKVLWDVHARALPAPLWIWLPGPPASTAAAAADLATSTMALRVWCARPWRQAAAHRAAQRLIERGEIEAITALSLRWPATLYRGERTEALRGQASSVEAHRTEAHRGDASRSESRAGAGGRHINRADGTTLSSSYGAIDLLMGFAALSTDRAHPSRMQAGVTSVVAREFQGTTSVLMAFDRGPTATALFSPAEDWNSPWPRLEICGSHGKSIVCEGGRTMQLTEPREPSRVLTPPVSPLVSTANVLGVAEELKGFFTAWSEARDASRPAPKYFPDLLGAKRVLEVVEALSEVLQHGVPVTSNVAPTTTGSQPAHSNGREPMTRRHAEGPRTTQTAVHNPNAVLPLYDSRSD